MPYGDSSLLLDAIAAVPSIARYPARPARTCIIIAIRRSINHRLSPAAAGPVAVGTRTCVLWHWQPAMSCAQSIHASSSSPVPASIATWRLGDAARACRRSLQMHACIDRIIYTTHIVRVVKGFETCKMASRSGSATPSRFCWLTLIITVCIKNKLCRECI